MGSSKPQIFGQVGTPLEASLPAAQAHAGQPCDADLCPLVFEDGGQLCASLDASSPAAQTHAGQPCVTHPCPLLVECSDEHTAAPATAVGEAAPQAMPACLESKACAVVFDHSDDAVAEHLWEGCAAVRMQGVVEADWAAAPHTQAAGRCLQIIHCAVHELCLDMLCSDCQLLCVWVAEHGRLHKRTREGLCERAIKACTQHVLYDT